MKKFLIVLGLLMLSVAVRDIQDTVIFHQATMIFQGTFFAYPLTYTLDAWHVSKVIEYGIYVGLFVWMLTLNQPPEYTRKRTWMLRLWYAFVMACAIALTHYLFFHEVYNAS